MRLNFLFMAVASLVVLPGLSHTMIGVTGIMSIDTRIGDLTLESSWHRNSTFDIRLSTRWDPGESGTLKINDVEKSVLSASTEIDYPLVVEANVAMTFECMFTVGDSTYSRTIHTAGAKKMCSSPTIAYDSVVNADGTRESEGVEMLAYSSLWDGGVGATVALGQNGVVFADGLSGAGNRMWIAPSDGTWTLTHTTYTNGVAGATEIATFVVQSLTILPYINVDAGGHKTIFVPRIWLEGRIALVEAANGDAEAALYGTAANGRKVWECYVLGLDPEIATNDFKITSFPMKMDGTPDLENMAFTPTQAEWNVPGAQAVLKGAATLDGEWQTVTEGNKAGFRFFKVVVELP